MFQTIRLCLLLMMFLLVAAQVQAQEQADSPTESKLRVASEKNLVGYQHGLNPSQWYWKISFNVNQTQDLGSDLEGALDQIEGVFNGDKVKLKVLHLNPELTIHPDEEIHRAETTFIPTLNFGFGRMFGKHQLEFDVGLMALLPLTTIDYNNSVTLRETTICDDSNRDDCPLANLGFVDPLTGEGKYNLDLRANEEIWIVSPSVYYDYAWLSRPWGQVTAGTSLGLFFASVQQKLEFVLEREDIGEDPSETRKLEGNALSTAINGFGFGLRVYSGVQIEYDSYRLDLRLGVQHTEVDLVRNVDGSATIFMGGTELPVSLPLSALEVQGEKLKDQETNHLELQGAFFHIGAAF